MTAEKIRENRLRRIADRRGYRVLKSRRRDPLAIGYGGYMIQDVETGGVVFGTNPREFSATLEEIEAYFDESQTGNQSASRRHNGSTRTKNGKSRRRARRRKA